MSEAELQHQEPRDEELDLDDEELAGVDASGRTIVVDPNPMHEIMKRAEQLRSETSDGVVYPCEYCQKVFKFKYEYERHAKIHSGDRPWQCPECMKTFSRKDNMRAHMKIHTGELVRHICHLCGKSYGRKYDLQVHERVHTGERPFECGSCGKSFISTSRLRAHQLIHCKNIYLPRHVRNKKLHLMKRSGAGAGRRRGGRRRKANSDSPEDSVDGALDDEEEDCDYDDEEEDEMEGEEAGDEADSGESVVVVDRSCGNGSGSGGRFNDKKQELQLVPQQQQLQQQQQQQLQQQLQLQQFERLQSQASISLMRYPARHISISLVKSCRQPRPKSVGPSANMDDPLSAESPEVPSPAEVENRLQLLEAALWQRKAELADRGIKVELDGLQGRAVGELNHTDFHVVLPTEPCKGEPA
ncbi:hypothetical protein BOX15_Mlig031714g1 [Macrostomum lignano]|uniref:C2H2-type domain-containing protein n=2 Tax=Macrostomum lignano TaxID=282301 RepID=A0A267GYH7_9PLAT|nr:hypothetical protein BOX15_Mlig031714g1 [Macrostomum lignano]